MNILYSENNSSTSNSSSGGIFGGDSSIIIWIILGVLIALLVAYFIYSWIKERIKKKKNKLAAIQMEKNSVIYWNEIAVKINELVKLNREKQENFVVSIGEFKMRELNNAASETLEEMMNEYEFKNFLISSEKYTNFVGNVRVLKDLNSNLWDKKLSNTVLKFFEQEVEKSEKAAKEANSTELNELKSPETLKEEIKEKYLSKLNKQEEVINE
ncbi:MHJ_0274 family protein [Mycoplasmopsis edwardii]|uniref:Uncharacterized protein n=1 Tax=Mycoplasmopsis edwardii TaxID=53558 RepID=A0ACD4PGN2_9BACT|nr:hypothetical protein [Mycoplasmopsis edwardii]WBP83782.1 hypothetical protein Me_995_000401 [Mycoplasmopsis edwardii]